MISVNEYELDDMQRRVKRARAIAVCAVHAANDPICDNSDDVALALDVVDSMLQSVITELEYLIEEDR
jgi:hypothetical protein